MLSPANSGKIKYRATIIKKKGMGLKYLFRIPLQTSADSFPGCLINVLKVVKKDPSKCVIK